LSKHPAPNRDHHDTFCVIEKWEIVRGSRGKPVTHHRTYELTLSNGDVLRTRISQPIDRTTYSAAMWAHILRDQLAVTATVFWDCVQNGVLPDRGGPPAANPNALPLHVLNQLVVRLGMSPEEAAAVPLADALEALRKYWTEEAEYSVAGPRARQAQVDNESIGSER